MPTQGGGELLFRRYRVLRELGRGGMGVVVLAHDTALDIPVAVKLVPDLVVKDTEAVSDLRKEVLRGMALNHDGVVRTHHFEKDESGAAIVMEFIEGDTLTDLKVRQPGGCFDPGQILPWLEQLCAVLDYAHREKRIIHRDLKPRNVMVTKEGRIKVADFGIAAVISDSMSRHSMEGKVSGTLSYMSPQQAEGKRPSHLDDIHALGATIYELLTGKPPFFRGNPAAIYHQILSIVPPSMGERREELEVRGKAAIPPQWEQTIAACLEKDAGERPQSTGEVLRRLGTIATESAAAVSLATSRSPGAGPILARETSSATLPPRPVSPSRARRWWGALATVALACGTALYLAGRSTDEQSGTAAPKLRSTPAGETPTPLSTLAPPLPQPSPAPTSIPIPSTPAMSAAVSSPIPQTPAPVPPSPVPAFSSDVPKVVKPMPPIPTTPEPAPAMARLSTPRPSPAPSPVAKTTPTPKKAEPSLVGVWTGRLSGFDPVLNEVTTTNPVTITVSEKKTLRIKFDGNAKLEIVQASGDGRSLGGAGGNKVATDNWSLRLLNSGEASVSMSIVFSKPARPEWKTVSSRGTFRRIE